MHSYVALLRAVNVGGTGKLPMKDLKSMCEEAGFNSVQTYIASGNVIFKSGKTEKQVKAVLEQRLEAYAGKPVGVMVRTAEELGEVLAANPFPRAAPNRVMAIFLDQAPPADAVDKASGLKSEEIVLGKREVYVHYGDGMGDSKLKLPVQKDGTARNMNTVARLVELLVR